MISFKQFINEASRPKEIFLERCDNLEDITSYLRAVHAINEGYYKKLKAAYEREEYSYKFKSEGSTSWGDEDRVETKTKMGNKGGLDRLYIGLHLGAILIVEEVDDAFMSPNNGEIYSDVFSGVANVTTGRRHPKWNDEVVYSEDIVFVDVSDLFDEYSLCENFLNNKVHPRAINFLLKQKDKSRYKECIREYVLTPGNVTITGVLKTKIKLDLKCYDEGDTIIIKKGDITEGYFSDLGQDTIIEMIEQAELGKAVVKKGLTKEDIIDLF
jgi:hypothetical protein